MSFIKNSFIFSIGTLLPKVSMFFLLPLYTKYLGAQEFGILESISVFSTIISIIFSLGIYNSIYRLYYDYPDENQKKTLFGTISLLVLFLSIIFSLFLFALQDYSSFLLKSVPFNPYFKYAIVSTLLGNLAELPKAYLLIKEKALSYTTIGIVQFILNNVFALYFLFYTNMGALGMIKSQLFASLLLAPLFIYFSKKYFIYKYEKKMAMNAIVYTLPTLPTLLAAWILNLSDRIFINHYIDTKSLGIYSLGYKISSIIGFLFTAIDMTYLPKYFKLANADSQDDRSKIQYINRLYILILIFFVFALSFFSKEIVFLFFSIEFSESYKIILIVSYVFFLTQASTLINKNLAQSKKIKQGMYIDISAALVNILLNFLLIPIFGIYGAAWATLLSFTMSIIIYYIYSKKNTFFVKFNLKEIFTLLFFSVLFNLIFFTINLKFVTSLILKISIFLLIIIAGFIKYKTVFIYKSYNN